MDADEKQAPAENGDKQVEPPPAPAQKVPRRSAEMERLQEAETRTLPDRDEHS
jgi:hypothetical protein